MTPCQGKTTVCDGIDLMPVRVGLRRDVRVFCAACRSTAGAMGLRIVERRVAAQPVAEDRRHSRPTWLARLVGRDESGRLVA